MLAIHGAYLDAGADIIETNTFTATRIAQADYGLVDVVREMNHEAARLARQAADLAEVADPGRPRYVMGALGPTNRTASISPKAEDPGARNVTFDELAEAYQEAAEGLIAGGADLLVIETIFDTLNAKAAIFGVEAAYDAAGDRIPLIISGTITDASGRTLSGQTVEAFWTSVMHARPIAVGLNCALGARQLRGHIADLSRIAGLPIIAYPNAGLPNEFGGYDEQPETTAAAPRPVRARRPDQHRGRLLRHDPCPRPGDRRGRGRRAAAARPGRRAQDAPVGPPGARRSPSRAACSSTSANGPTSPAHAASPSSSSRIATTKPSRWRGSRSTRAPRSST